MNHWVIYLDNNSDKKGFLKDFQKESIPQELQEFENKIGSLFSPFTLEKLIDKEDKHDKKIISTEHQALETMSSGEQKRALLHYLLNEKPDYIILDNPFDSLDIAFQEALKTILKDHSKHISFIQLASRKSDTLSFINCFGKLNKNMFSITEITPPNNNEIASTFNAVRIPKSITTYANIESPLIDFKDVSISYGNKKILNAINWTVDKDDFWQLSGTNGSGKSTILSMIFGDNPKAFGQEIYLFGNKKGSGESVWDIKQKIGYYAPAMTLKFNGRHSIEHMLISGLNDSVGLYTIPTELQKRIIKQWLLLLNLYPIKNKYFNTLSTGQQRLVMTARAMVKRPPILILDEPTTDMDDESASLLVSLVNKFAEETDTAIIFVSHRKEKGLKPKRTLDLIPSENGSSGIIK
ncbi:ATP-binding cassette domain-containing protein [Maribacter sp. 1_MG-2023]|uniref:ATP-binding cassette domain-containing protein n=1 Tax=Maribacter sp. 1_MG-2023 TaxID=3062677 RepID=UPI0026E47A48|nr:ATP-binding cassette domain-containing protein [Maribacter sp. 1_MG-2023]MDO6470326.1 ATP-binding cassette domain-containing protein [Maribacter sp. 1_MG-2023]